MIPLKSKQEIALMAAAGSLLAEVLEEVRQHVLPGVTTGELDKLAEELIRDKGAVSAFKGYHGYPATLCASVNDVVVHGIPGKLSLADGDIIGLDLGLLYRGFYSDIAITVGVGKISAAAKKLIETTRSSLNEGIKKAAPGNRLGDISAAVQLCAETNGFSVVRQFVGHGIGKAMHEEPEIPNFGLKGSGPELTAGMALAIEPMLNQGSWECQIDQDGWTARTRDGKLSAHFEHTVIITETGPQVLTRI
jgi:methionyl aminopeptidase